MGQKRVRLVSGRGPLWVLALLCVAGPSGCTLGPRGDAGGGKEGERAGPAAGGGMISAEKVKSCAGFTAEAAATLLGVSATGIVDQSSDIYEKLRNCSFVDPQNPDSRLTFSLRRDDSVEEAAQEMAAFREHLGVARRAVPGAEGSANAAAFEEVSGLGDEAVWAPVNGTLNVRKGNVTIQVASPEDREAQKRVAEKVLEGLG